MRFCVVETIKFDVIVINYFDVVFVGYRFEVRLYCVLFQRLFFFYYFFYQLCDQVFGKLVFRQLGNDGFADALVFGFVGWYVGGYGRRYRDRFIIFGDGKIQQIRYFTGFRGNNVGAQNYGYCLFVARVCFTNIIRCDEFFYLFFFVW